MDTQQELIHTVSSSELSNNPQWNMPYAPAVKVSSGKPLYISGVNAAPIYHSHPHQAHEFDQLDFSVSNQAKLTMDNLQLILEKAGGTLSDIVQLFIFIIDVPNNADAIGQVLSSYFNGHLYSSTVVGVNALITDPRLVLEITATAYLT